MTISLICACKNRNEPLRIALTSWLLKKEITEIIIVDWSSDESLASLTKLDSRIKVITVQDQKYFNQPQPLNLAASIATGDYILKVDCDYIFSPYYNFFDTYQIDENSFVSGKHNIKNYEIFDGQDYVVDTSKMSLDEIVEYVNSYSPIFKHLVGLLFISKENFNKVGGYNESLGKYYAYEDDEIFHRLRVLGLEEKKLNFDYNLLHIPHSDKKRVENFEGYDSQQLNDIKNSLIVEDENSKQWNAEYILTMEHIEENKKIAPLTNEYYVRPQTQWNVQQIDDQNYYANKVMNNKLENFPSVYYVSLEESTDRQENIERQFSEYGITPTAILSKRFSESDDEITGKFLDQMNNGTIGCVVSHLKAIRKWYEETDEDYAFFCEDDLSLETIQYWDFTWEEFIETIPEDACCVQLLVIRKEYETFNIRKRFWDDWAGTAYIITRNYAKTLVENYCLGEKRFHLELPGSGNVLTPLLENVLFETLEDVCYTIPLFVEDIRFNTTFSSEEDKEVNGGQKNGHIEAYSTVLNHWKNKMKSFKVTKQEQPNMNQIETLLTLYSNDPENAGHNFNLGVWYWNEEHTAPALSYFLRCAERSEDNVLAYEALLWAHQCYEKQGTRDSTARTLLQHAVNLLPTRPEAYFLLAKFHSKRQQWTDAYSVSHQGLTFLEKNLEPLKNSVGYLGEFSLLYEKAVASWWWGKGNETRKLLQDLKNNYELPEYYENLVQDLSTKCGIIEFQQVESDFTYPDNFNWSTLTYEDIVTIEREIVHEKVYRFWKDVKEGDVVLDIGASVGAYTISILDQKPKKVYCVEPSGKFLKVLSENCFEKVLSYSENPLVYVNYGIVDNSNDSINIFGDEKQFKSITFNDMIKKYSIDHVDYMKVDCEGGEYSIFKEENMDFLLNKVNFIAMEIHLNYNECREKFKNFRDNYLNKFNNYKVMSCTRQHISWGNVIDLKEKIFDNDFIDTYNCEFMIYIKKN